MGAPPHSFLTPLSSLRKSPKGDFQADRYPTIPLISRAFALKSSAMRSATA